MCLHISSRLTLRWPAAFAARPLFCTSSRSLANSAMQGGVPPPPPNGEACGGMAPIGAGGGMREAEDGERSPGHGAEADGAEADGAEADGAVAVARGGSDGHGAGAAV